MTRLPTVFAAAFLAAAACDSPGGDGGDSTGGGFTPSPEPGPEAEPEAEPETAGPCRQTTSVQGAVQDEDGNPVQGAKVQACIRSPKKYLCIQPVDSAADGTYAISVSDPDLQCMDELTMRTFVPLASWATNYCDVELEPGPETLDLGPSIRLFDTLPPVTLPPFGDPLEPRTVVYEGGLEVDVVPDHGFLFEEDYAKLRGRWVEAPPEDLCMKGAVTAAKGAWAFTPEFDIYSALETYPPYAARIPTDLPNGTEVEVYVMGGLQYHDYDGNPLQEGIWHPITTATVKQGVIDLSTENGLPFMTWVTYVEK